MCEVRKIGYIECGFEAGGLAKFYFIDASSILMVFISWKSVDMLS